MSVWFNVIKNLIAERGNNLIHHKVYFWWSVDFSLTNYNYFYLFDRKTTRIWRLTSGCTEMERALAWLVDKQWKGTIVLRRESRSSTDRKSIVKYSEIKWFETSQANSILIAYL